MIVRRMGWKIGMLVYAVAFSTSGCGDGAHPDESRQGSSIQPQVPASSGSVNTADILASATEGGWYNADLLVTSGDPLEVAKKCVQDRSGAASCYSFLTREAYQAAGARSAGDFVLTCWAARWTRNKAGSVSGGLNDFMPSACPTSSRPESPEPVQDPPPPESSSEPYELELTVDHTVTAGRQVLLQGTTNLPDGTRLSTSVSGGGFMGQAEAAVSAGRWQSGPFGPPAGLAPGTYEGSVTLPYGRTQPEGVQARLGQQLERLTGPLMKTNPELAFMGQSATVKARVTVR